MSDLIERLRELPTSNNKLRDDVADEIQRLRASEAYMASKLEQTLVIEGELRQRIAELEQALKATAELGLEQQGRIAELEAALRTTLERTSGQVTLERIHNVAARALKEEG